MGALIFRSVKLEVSGNKADVNVVARMLRDGRTQANIALHLGVTRERIRQIANGLGLNERCLPFDLADSIASPFREAVGQDASCYRCGAPKSVTATICERCGQRRRILGIVRVRLRMYFERGTKGDLTNAVYYIRKFDITPEEMRY